MTLSLYVDGVRWREHLTRTKAAFGDLVPVAKGNGYGFGVPRLARRAEWLGVDTVAVGTYREVDDVLRRFSGSVLVMEPWRPSGTDPCYGDRIIHTVGRLGDLATLGEQVEGRARVVIEALTSMRRHGLDAPSLVAAERDARRVRVEGHALHLPFGSGHLREAEHWLTAAPTRRWFVSHLEPDEVDGLRARHPDVAILPRVGTSLWLGDGGSLSVRATVLDVHAVNRGDRVGYRQRRIRRPGHVLVVSGGTSHGVALEAPTPASSTRQRAVAVARGGLDAVGRALSPFVVDGRRRWFVEPPHMQVSMIFLPHDAAVPDVGDEADVRVRFTTTHFDRVEIS